MILHLFLSMINSLFYASIYVQQASINLRAVSYITVFYYFLCRIAKLDARRNKILKRIRIWIIIVTILIVSTYGLVPVEINYI